jgi:hypothetical protein
MKYLKTALRYSVYGVMMPLILLAILSTFVVVILDWYVEKMQFVVEKVSEACG